MRNPDFPKGRVLIAEDDADTGAVLSLALRLEGYEVQVARSVAQAQEHFRQQTVDLMILDWLLLDGTGDEVCGMARSVDPDIPIIVMSAVVNEQTRAVTKCQPILFLAKPIRIKILTDTVHSLLAELAKKRTQKARSASEEVAAKAVSREK